MSKSYTPLRPRGKRNPPDWYNMKGTFAVDSLVTDDTEFGPGLVRTAGKFLYFAYRRNAQWFTVTVDSRRVKGTTNKREVD